jgi:predicted dehydrogenase
MGALRDELSYFATCVARGNEPDRVSPQDGIEAVRLALAAAESGARRTRVSLDPTGPVRRERAAS